MSKKKAPNKRMHSDSKTLDAKLVMKIFRRQTLKERGHFSNYFTLRPVYEIGFSEEKLRIIRGRQHFEIPYGQLNAKIIERYIHKPYGAGIGANIKQTLIRIIWEGTEFIFDLSSQFPDFKDRKNILALIQNNISTTVSSNNKKAFILKQKIQFYVAIFVLLIVFGFITLRRYGI